MRLVVILKFKGIFLSSLNYAAYIVVKNKFCIVILLKLRLQRYLRINRKHFMSF